jgi:hypothetical protein
MGFSEQRVVPSTTPRRYRADHSPGRVLAHQCRKGLYRLHASPSVPPLFAAQQRSATGGVGTLGAMAGQPGLKLRPVLLNDLAE